MRLAVGLSRKFHRPVSELQDSLSEAEFRLQQVYGVGEPDAEHRLDYWLGSLLSTYLNVHRKSESSPVKIRDVTPKWGWEGKSQADEEQKMKAATNALLAWVQAMSQPRKDPKKPARKRKSREG